MENYLQEITYNNIYVRHAVDCNPDDSYCEMHIHTRCEIFYFVSGRAEYLVEGSKYPLEHGSVVIMRPAEAHRSKILADKLYERYTVNFPLSAADSIDPERILMKPFLDRPLGIGNLYLSSEFDGAAIENYFKKICGCKNNYETNVEIQLCRFIFAFQKIKSYTKRFYIFHSNRLLPFILHFKKCHFFKVLCGSA